MTGLRTYGACLCCAVGVLTGGSVLAQQRPLETQDPEPIPDEKILIETGVVYLRDQTFPVSGLRGHYTHVPSFGFRVGVGGRAEFQVEHASFQHLRVMEQFDAPRADDVTESGDTTWDFDDLVIGAKIRILGERSNRPSIGLHHSTRLPNASTESGLGKDTMDFRNSLLLGKSFGPVRTMFNLGLGILGDPTEATTQNDVIIYGVSVVGRVTERFEALWEINGHRNTRIRLVPPGTDSSAFTRVGLRYLLGDINIDGAVVWGIHEDDARIGGTVGISWMFDGIGAT